jgi:uncharacterized membrane protein YhhN
MLAVPFSLLIIALALAVATLLVGIRSRLRPLEVGAKSMASALLLLLAATRLTAGEPFATRMLVGLLLCAAGDLLLLGERTFDAGLLAFLAGHLAYLSAFLAVLPLASWSLWPVCPLALVAAGSAAWLWPRLGRRRAPVAAYMVAISAMTWGALAAATAGAVAWTAAPGAVLFLLSDLAVARHRFVHPAFVNRCLGLPAYYLGQLLLVLTIGPSR